MTTFTTPYSLPIIEPNVDRIKDGAEASALAGDINQLSNAANAAMVVLAGTSYWKRNLVAGDDLNTLAAGAYTATNGTIATALGFPTAKPATLFHVPVSTGGSFTQSLQTVESTGVIPRYFVRSRLGTATTAWTELANLPFWNPTGLLSTTDIYALPAGTHYISSVVVARALLMPRERPGILTIFPVGASGKLMTFTSIEDSPQPALTYVGQRTLAGVVTPWQKVAYEGAGGTTSGDAGPARRSLLQQAIVARKGGGIGTSGKGVIALRFDDAPADFVTKILPLLVERGLPFTRVSTSDSIASTGEVVTDAKLVEMQTYSIQNGGEVWNHGRDHADASGESTIYDNLIGSLDRLRSLMPRIPIDCFAPPGGSVSYDGHMPSNTVANWADTYAGRTLLAYHGLASGYFQNSYYRPLDGNLRDGQIHYSVDAYTLANAKTLVDRARDWKTGIVMMWHAHNLDKAGYMTTADLALLLDYIAEQRDSDKLVVLTKSGLGVADVSSIYRDNILQSSTGSPYSATVLYPQFQQNIPGSTRELVATVTGTVGATITSVIGESTKTHTIPAGGVLKLRHCATIPLDATALSVTINGNTTNARLLAV